MKNYENEFVKYVNEVTNNNYENMNEIYECEYMDDIEGFLDDFCDEYNYNFFEVSKTL